MQRVEINRRRSSFNRALVVLFAPPLDSSVVHRLGINPGVSWGPGIIEIIIRWPSEIGQSRVGRGWFEGGPCIEIPAHNRVFRFARVRVFGGRACSSDDERRLVDGGGGWGRGRGWPEEGWERLAENNESPGRLAATMPRATPEISPRRIVCQPWRRGET